MPEIYKFSYVEKLAKGGKRKKARNPELLVVGENPKGGKSMAARKRRRSPFRVKVGGRRMSYRSLVKKYGVKKASRMYRGKAKFHRGKKVRVCKRRKAANGRRRRTRGRNGALRKRIGGRYRTWKALVKQHGVKRASKMWRGVKCVSHNRKRRRRRSRRKF